MTTPVLFQFLDAVTDIDTLLTIRREIEGEGADPDSDDEEVADDPLERVRKPSKTMFVLLKKFGAETKGFTSDWQCFLAFLRIHIAEVCDLPVDKLDHRLTQLARSGL